MLISAIMPTYNRREFIPQALKYFERQDYPHKELIIVDDGTDTIIDILPTHLNICYISLSERCSLGTKCNIACSLANGEVICHFDDDDYFAPHRLTHQVQPILQGKADIVGVEMDVVFNIVDWTAWKCSSSLRSEIFYGGVVTGAMMYRKALWGMHAMHPNKTTGEDADFLRHLRTNGAKLATVANAGSFIYIRHGDTWPLLPHYHPHMHEWSAVKIEEHMPDEDRAFYAQLRKMER